MSIRPLEISKVPLPVEEMITEILTALSGQRRVIVQAPPGSGKTTCVPRALLRSSLCEHGQILLLQPRRVAARAVARTLARLEETRVGDRVGYAIRMDRKASKNTRILVVTEGVLTAWLQRDPSLEGVACVILDEFHERSIHGDLALALVKEVQESLRPDLCLVVMSATLDPAPLRQYLGGCELVESSGRIHPLTVTYMDKMDDASVSHRTGRAILDVEKRLEGDLLVFLPGVPEIHRTAAYLEGRLDRDVFPLYGALAPEAQDRVLQPGKRPRVILSTNIAETSLTVPGIVAVIDSGFHKLPFYDPSEGANRLVLKMISKASADQRAGRAGRLGPGKVWRLWTEHTHGSLPDFDKPEITRLESVSMMLQLLYWGVPDLHSFPFYEAPSTASLQAARTLLDRLGATDKAKGGLTSIGRSMAQIPCHPRVARFLIDAASKGLLEELAPLAALLEHAPRVPLNTTQVSGCDLFPLRKMLSGNQNRENKRLSTRLVKATQAVTPQSPKTPEPELPLEEHCCRLLISGWPDRIARRLNSAESTFVLYGGHKARLAEQSSVRDDTYILALDVDAGRRGNHNLAKIRLASRIDPLWLQTHPDYHQAQTLTWDDREGRVQAVFNETFMDFILSQKNIPLTQGAEVEEMLVARTQDTIAHVLHLDPKTEQLLIRILTVLPSLESAPWPTERTAILKQLLPSLARGCSSLRDLKRADVHRILREHIPWQLQDALTRLAPTKVRVPSGREVSLTYQMDAPPILAVKVQEMYGCTETPCIGPERTPVLLHLLNPAGRPLQITQDLAGFWRGTWPEVRKEMRSRYPKHRWPESPLTAAASTRTTKPKSG
jgi:ATP-dependent helicase HrpB